MARETIIRLKDDLDGTDASVTVRFSWDGVAYEIDLSKKNAAAFTEAVAPYTTSARRVTAAGRPRARAVGRAVSATAKPDLTAVRQWAGKNGFTVAARGRIPAAVTEAFAAAQSAPATTVEPVKASAAKVPARKAAAKKAPAKKAAARKSPAKKSTARKAAAKKA